MFAQDQQTLDKTSGFVSPNAYLLAAASRVGVPGPTPNLAGPFIGSLAAGFVTLYPHLLRRR